MTTAADAEDDTVPRTAEEKQFIKQLALKRTIWIGTPTAPFETHFKIGDQLGDAGQYGTTYRCTRIADGKRFAVKELPKNRFHRIPPKLRLRYLSTMQTEIDVLQVLGDHPNIVKLIGVYEDKPTLRLVMEECTGGELFQRIIAREKYSEPDGAYVLKQLFSALQYMHVTHEIVHCDLKPDNILFSSPDDKAAVKIIDFGMSKVLPRLQYLTHLCGTPYYTAPEIIAAAKEDRRYNHQADMWSMGVIMYVMIFGYPPFYVDPERYQGKRERQAIYRKILKGFRAQVIDTERYGYGPWFPSHIPVSPWCRDLLANLLHKDVAKRYTATEALAHPWIVHGGSVPESMSYDGRASGEDSKEESSDASLPKKKQLITSIAKFSKGCQFKQVVIKLFAKEYAEMRPHHFADLERLFQELDTDGDGVITYEEFQSALAELDGVSLTKKQISEIFGELDLSEMDGLKFEDLLGAVVHDYLVACDERLYRAFCDLDDDNDGFITTDQLKDKLKEIDPLGEWDRAMEIIAEQALDDSGRICYEEFLLALHPNFEETPEWVPDLYKMKSMAPSKKASDKSERKSRKKKAAAS